MNISSPNHGNGLTADLELGGISVTGMLVTDNRDTTTMSRKIEY